MSDSSLASFLGEVARPGLMSMPGLDTVSLVVPPLAFAMGSLILGRVAFFCALDRNEGFFHSSILSCFAMGSPGGSSVWFPALDRNEAVFG